MLLIAWKGDMHLLIKSATISIHSEQNNSSLRARVIRDKACLISHILEGLLTILLMGTMFPTQTIKKRAAADSGRVWAESQGLGEKS